MWTLTYHLYDGSRLFWIFFIWRFGGWIVGVRPGAKDLHLDIPLERVEHPPVCPPPPTQHCTVFTGTLQRTVGNLRRTTGTYRNPTAYRRQFRSNPTAYFRVLNFFSSGFEFRGETWCRRPSSGHTTGACGTSSGTSRLTAQPATT